MKFDAVLFDLDGTLLNTLTDLATSANNALTELGFATHCLDDYRYFVGRGMDGLVKQIVPAQFSSDQPLLDKCLELAKAQYAEHWADTTVAYPGIPQLLTELDNLGIAKTVFSNKPDEFTQLNVDKFLADWSFAIVYGVRPDIPKKPDPAAAVRITAELSIPPERLIYLGDSNTDMQTATAAGMYPAGALWGYRDAAELIAAGAETVLKHPLDMLKLLKGDIKP